MIYHQPPPPHTPPTIPSTCSPHPHHPPTHIYINVPLYLPLPITSIPSSTIHSPFFFIHLITPLSPPLLCHHPSPSSLCTLANNSPQSILELVDEFIDNVATTACKMAKLRGSDTLDIKDIQIILERNWNIRIPGYAADEIRTVRKFNPAPGYHQKMAALAAQKQLNQTAGKGGD